MKTVMYTVIGLLLVVLILALTGKKSVHHEITINATPQEVWKVLMDIDSYPEWNPVMQLMKGEVKEGNQVTYQFTQDENTTTEIGVNVIKISPGKLLNQKGGIPLVLNYDHSYTLEEEGMDTNLTIHEDYRGIYVHFWNPEPVGEAYKRLNMALKERVESLRKL